MLDELKTFVLFAETGSIRRTADRIPLTQPAVSRQIQRLEETLGVELLDRRVKPPKLSPSGSAILLQCRKVLSAIDELKIAAAPGGAVTGQLRVGVVHALAGPVLGKTFEGIQARFPGVSLSIASGWSDDLLRSLERGDLDAVVTLSARGGGGATDGEERRVVAEDRIVVIAPRDIPVKRRASIEQLAGQQWVLSPETQCRMRARIRAAFEERGMPFKVAAEVHDFELQVSLVEQGFGLSLIPQSRIRRQLARGRLRTLALPEFDFPADVVLAASPLIGKLGAVVDEMESQLKQALRPR